MMISDQSFSTLNIQMLTHAGQACYFCPELTTVNINRPQAMNLKDYVWVSQVADTNRKLMCNVLFVPSVQPEGHARPFCVAGLMLCYNHGGGTAGN